MSFCTLYIKSYYLIYDMSTNSIIHKKLIGKLKCKCSNSSHISRHFQYLKNKINIDEMHLQEIENNYSQLQMEISTLEEYVKPYNKILLKKRQNLKIIEDINNMQQKLKKLLKNARTISEMQIIL